MRRTPEQEDINGQIWTLFTSGQVTEAITLGEEHLRQPPREENAAFHRHLAMQLVDIYKRLAKGTRESREVAKHWHSILKLISMYYPLATTQAVAEEKTASWADVLPGETSQIHAWRSAVDEIELMGVVAGSPQLISFSHAVLRHAIDASKEAKYSDRTMQIVAIKNGSYQEAADAFMHFVEKYGVGTRAGMPDQQIQLASIMLGRARLAGDANIQKLARQQLSELQFQSTWPGEADLKPILQRNKSHQYVPFLPRLQNLKRAIQLAPQFLVGNAREDAKQLRQTGEELLPMWIGMTPSLVKRVRS